MKDWLRTYGWKFALALIVVAVAIAYLVQLERKANGVARITAPAAGPLYAARGASARAGAPTIRGR